MKKTIFILILLLYFAHANATNYYLSSSSGNDQFDGNTAKTAWQTISKLGLVLGTLQPGDSVFFKCDDTFPGQLILSKSGSAEKKIYFGSFGSGKKPIISGTSTVSNWTQTATNIWETTCTDCASKVTSFFINDIPQQVGRWPNATEPNKGYLTYESHSGTNQVTMIFFLKVIRLCILQCVRKRFLTNSEYVMVLITGHTGEHHYRKFWNLFR